MAWDQHTPALRERRFYLWIAAFLAATTLVGFARTYYFRSYFHSPQLRPFLHYHGAVMTAWIVLFLVQSVLIARRRVRLHRALGYVGAGLALLVVIMGSAATIIAAAREVRGHTAYVPLRLNVLALELTQMALFAIFVGIALWMRRRPDVHKRCMLLATLCMLPNPQLRVLPFINNNLVYLALWSAQIFLFVGLDALLNRRVHPAFLRGALVANVALYVAQFASNTTAWRQFASRVIT
jgi:hypothetical protein